MAQPESPEESMQRLRNQNVEIQRARARLWAATNLRFRSANPNNDREDLRIALEHNSITRGRGLMNPSWSFHVRRIF